MKRRDLHVAVWFVAGAAPVAMVIVFILSLSGKLNPAIATIDMAIMLVIGVACQALARFWKPDE